MSRPHHRALTVLADDEAVTRFKDLCIDVNDPGRAAEFWSPALGLTPQVRADGMVLLTGANDTDTIWLNEVPEPKAVKNRVHLDVNAESVDDLVRLGASIIDGTSFGWTVLADPEGGELCAFVRPPGEVAERGRFYELVIDSVEPERIAGWWRDRFDAQLDGGGDEVSIAGGDGPPWDMVFGTVPEPKRGKNRIHWDVWGDTAEFLAAGATLLRARDDQISWDVLADPEGNEFCVFAA